MNFGFFKDQCYCILKQGVRTFSVSWGEARKKIWWSEKKKETEEARNFLKEEKICLNMSSKIQTVAVFRKAWFTLAIA